MKLGAYVLPGVSREEHVEASHDYAALEMFNDDHVPYMDGPGLKLKYRNAVAVDINNTQEFNWFQDNDLLLRNGSGLYAVHKRNTQNHHVFLGSQAYRDWLAEWVEGKISIGYDGIFGDLLGLARVRPPWDMDPPLDPRTGQLYTDDAWATDMRNLIIEIQGDHVICGNAVPQASGPYGYYQNQEVYDWILPELDMVMIEGAWGWSASDPRTQQNWFENTRLINEQDYDWWVMQHYAEGDALFVYASMMLAGEGSAIYTYGNKAEMERAPWTDYMVLDAGEVESGIVDQGGGWYAREYEHISYQVDAVNKVGWYRVKQVEPEPEPPEPEPPVPVPPAASGSLIDLLKGFAVVGTVTFVLKELQEDEDDS
jgi:hypothetical protein